MVADLSINPIICTAKHLLKNEDDKRFRTEGISFFRF